MFSGTVRDHAEGRDGVEELVYEAYEEPAAERFAAIAAEARALADDRAAGDDPSPRFARCHGLGGRRRRVGAHRDEAFEAGRFVIDTLKETVPIWKHETWRDGADWGTGAAPIRDVEHVAGGAA